MSPEGERPGKVTLTQVAARAGTSVQTASQVLSRNPKARISPETRTRVLIAAEALGYRPNRAAQAVRGGRTGIVSLWMPVERPVVAFLHALNALTRLTRADGYELLIVGLTSDQAYGADPAIPNPFPTDGILAIDCGRCIRQLRLDPAMAQVPTVLMGSELFDGADTVSWDVRGGASDATRRMFETGSHRVAYVAPRWVLDDYPNEQRRTGYTEAVTSRGLEPWIIPVPEETAADTVATLRHVLTGPETPDAFLCFAGPHAVGVIDALLDAGHSVPRTHQVWTYGEYPEATHHRVPVSSFSFPVEDMADAAWRCLRERMVDPAIPARHERLAMRVTERASSRACPPREA